VVGETFKVVVVKFEYGAPVIFVYVVPPSVLTCHWYEALVPAAVAEMLAELPTH